MRDRVGTAFEMFERRLYGAECDVKEWASRHESMLTHSACLVVGILFGMYPEQFPFVIFAIVALWWLPIAPILLVYCVARDYFQRRVS